MLELRLFKNPRFAVSSGGITLVFFAMFGSFFMLAQYFQGVIGWSPLGAALRLLPFSAVMMVIAPNTPKLVGRLGANRVGAIGLSSVAIGMIGTQLFFDVDTAYWVMLIVIFFLAAGMAMTMTPMTTQLMAAVPRDRAGMGSATNDTTRELGGALGVAVLGSLLTGQFANGVAPAVEGLPAAVREEAEGGLGGVIGLNFAWSRARRRRGNGEARVRRRPRPGHRGVGGGRGDRRRCSSTSSCLLIATRWRSLARVSRSSRMRLRSTPGSPR